MEGRRASCSKVINRKGYMVTVDDLFGPSGNDIIAAFFINNFILLIIFVHLATYSIHSTLYFQLLEFTQSTSGHDYLSSSQTPQLMFLLILDFFYILCI